MAQRPVPHQLPVADALRENQALGSLLQRIRQSQARLDAVSPLLPDALRGAVRAGPLDDAGWSLLVAHSAAAAKLRQMLPQLRQHLQQAGWPDLDIRLKVQGR